jgi:hypothetical protein
LTVPDVAAIRSAETAVVTHDHQAALDLAGRAVNLAQAALTGDRLNLQNVEQQAAAAASAEAAATSQLATDRAAQFLAGAANQAAEARLALDRDRLRGLVLGLYTGAVTGPQPITLQSLGSDQQAAFGRGEAQVVAEFTVKDLHLDVAAGQTAARQLQHATRTVAADGPRLNAARDQAEVTAAQVPGASAAVAGAEHVLTAAQRQLGKARGDLRSAVAALAGPPAASPSGLSLLGGAALTAPQLTSWYNAQGYVDLTTTPVSQLASWYVRAGAAEGIRGDVAFAQAVLETGGFSSPDAVGLNNYAGIGHCDTCPAGWAFPSPHAGVIGQMQLLRIYAERGAAPPGAPPAVLPALVPTLQGRGGCCPTWESLTGVWATDPLYGAEILDIYAGMLAFAAGPPSSGQPAQSSQPGQSGQSGQSGQTGQPGQ